MKSPTLTSESLETGRGDDLEFAELRHWRVRSDGGLFWLLLDQKDSDDEPSSANTLNTEVLDELDHVLTHIEKRQPQGVVIRSTKSSGFIAGADIHEFRNVSVEVEINEKLASAHQVVNRLAAFCCPTVAVIHGHCLGGGLELALACDYRLARSDASLGFPEVQLGLHPGLGGTVRLPRLIDPARATQMMLTGKPVTGAQALGLGLVDGVVDERHVHKAVGAAVQGELKTRRKDIKQRLLSIRPAKNLIIRLARNQTRKSAAPEHYPAPYALLRLLESNAGALEKQLARERTSFAELLVGETAQNLVRVFFLREAMKARKHQSSDISHVHLIGAGTMGGDIAAWCAHRGFKVTVEDRSADFIAPAMARASALFKYRYRSQREQKAVWDRLVPDLRGAGRCSADLIIEAVPERADLKQEVLGQVQKTMKDTAILATNTSGILLEELRDVVDDSSRFAGLHFFNPVSRMQLVEIVRHDGVADATINRLLAFTGEIDRLPVEVSSSPGFLVNRILTPYLLEAVTMLDEGIQAESIDQMIENFGMPVGPMALADQIGLDVALEVADNLHANLDQALPTVPDWLRAKVAKGELGVKTGQGIFRYRNGVAEKKDIQPRSNQDHIDRLLLPIVNTAVQCLAEQVVAGADTVDGAMIFGTGFAPFRGGPLHYARGRGPAVVKQLLQDLAEKSGERFAPSPAWDSVFKQQ